MSMRASEEIRNIQIDRFGDLLVVRSGGKSRDSCVYISFAKTKTVPFPDKPAEGIFQISLEKGKKNDILHNLIHNVYVKSKCICLGDLCLKPSREVHSINIGLYPIQTDGDLYRLCIEGINTALKLLDVKTYFQPQLFQYANVGKSVMADPDDGEITASNWGVIVVMKSTREMLLVEGVGGENTVEEILECVDLAMKTVRLN